jgi:hypothetical protein
MRRVLIGGLIGAVPGLLLMAVAIGTEMWVETGGGLGIGIMGLMLVWLGIFVGASVGAAKTDFSRSVKRGAGIGFLVGFVGAFVTSSTGLGIGISWLVLTPIAMIVGGLIGAWRGEHRHVSGTAVPGH